MDNRDQSIWRQWDIDGLVERLLAERSGDLSEETLISALSQLDLVEILEPFHEDLRSTLRRSAPRMLAEHRRDRRQFERRIELVWGPALDLLYQLRMCCRELGSSFNDAHRPTASAEQDLKFEALVRIHSRACNTHADIHALLRSGFAEAAWARWRSLHELDVVASLLAAGDQDLAKRFMAHGDVEAYKDAAFHNQHASESGGDPIPEQEMADLKAIRDNAVAEFGVPITRQWGWASELLDKERPNFVDLEDEAGRSPLRAEVRLANHFVHGGSSSARLALREFRGGDLFQAGPSNGGLAEPGHGSAISLFNVTAALLVDGREFDYTPIVTVSLGVVRQLVDDTGAAFQVSKEKLDRMERTVTGTVWQRCQQQARSRSEMIGLSGRLLANAIGARSRRAARRLRSDFRILTGRDPD